MRPRIRTPRMKQTAKTRILLAVALATAVTPVAAGDRPGEVEAALEEATESSRVLLRVAPDATVVFDAEGGPWIYPGPQLRRPSMNDFLHARLVRDRFVESGLVDLRPALQVPRVEVEAFVDRGLDRWLDGG